MYVCIQIELCLLLCVQCSYMCVHIHIDVCLYLCVQVYIHICVFIYT